MKFPLDWLIFNRWYWITVLGCFAVMIGPLIIIYLMFFLPATAKAVAFFGIIVGWGVASGYKDWSLARKEDKKTKAAYKRL